MGQVKLPHIKLQDFCDGLKRAKAGQPIFTQSFPAKPISTSKTQAQGSPPVLALPISKYKLYAYNSTLLKHLTVVNPGAARSFPALRMAHAGPLIDKRSYSSRTNANPRSLSPSPAPTVNASGVTALLALLGLGIAGGYAYKLHNSGDYVPISTFDGRKAWLKTITPEVFEFGWAMGEFGIGDERVTRHLLLSEEESEAVLKKGESSTVIDRPGNPVVRWDKNYLPSREKGEDHHAIDIIPRPELFSLVNPDITTAFWKAWGDVRNIALHHDDKLITGVAGDGTKDVMMISVFDGHGGEHGTPDGTSRLLKKTLHGCLAWTFGRDDLVRGGILGKVWDRMAGVNGPGEGGYFVHDQGRLTPAILET